MTTPARQADGSRSSGPVKAYCFVHPHRSWHYRCRLRETLSGPDDLGAGRGAFPRPASLLLCVSGKPAAAAAPQQVAKPAEEDERSQDSEPHHDVVDGGHEVVGRVAERGLEAPAV